jgi:excisionase family DNA binding protein
MSTEILLNTNEAARMLQVNAAIVDAWAQSGRMPAIKLGRRWRFPRSDLKAWLNQNKRDSRLKH